MEDRSTSILLKGKQSIKYQTSTGIPQGSPVSPILYLFFNADLVEACSNPEGKQATGIGFVDNVNVLAYSSSTEENCKILEEMYQKCIYWANKHGAEFFPHKYNLIHLTKKPRKFGMAASINLESIQIDPKASIRILGVQIDSKLSWI